MSQKGLESMKTTVQQEATGMKYLDPSRPSPAAEAFANMLVNFDGDNLAYIASKVDEAIMKDGGVRP